MKVKKVGVLGCGLMGSGIAEVAARAGFTTVVREVSEELLEKGRGRIEKSLAKAVAKGRLEEGERENILGRVSGVVELEDMADCDLVIEAIVENVEAKRQIFTALDELVKKTAMFASNTSSLTITQIAMSTQRPERFLGLHFFNPVPVMKLVEVVRTLVTSDETVERATTFVRALGKEPVACRDNSGFIVNRPVGAVPARRHPRSRRRRGLGRRYRQGHATGLWLPHGAVYLARLRWPGYDPLHCGHHVRRVSREALRAAAALEADGARRSVGPQERSRFLRVSQEIGRWLYGRHRLVRIELAGRWRMRVR